MSGQPADAPIAPGSRLGLHVVLYLLTCLTTTGAGALYLQRPFFDLQAGLAFSVPLMAILTFHEFGHYIAARLHGVPASLPYFIPMPLTPFGTMGAVISQQGTTDRTKLIDIGAAGPLAGLVVAIPVLIYGLQQSPVSVIPAQGTQEGNSILYLGLKYLIKGAWLPAGGKDVMLHPTAFAGWAGLLVTMLNLLPIGQLDGGHVATAYFGNRYARVARLFHRALPWLALLVFAWVSWSSGQELESADDTVRSESGGDRVAAGDVLDLLLLVADVAGAPVRGPGSPAHRRPPTAAWHPAGAVLGDGGGAGSDFHAGRAEGQCGAGSGRQGGQRPRVVATASDRIRRPA